MTYEYSYLFTRVYDIAVVCIVVTTPSSRFEGDPHARDWGGHASRGN